MALLLTAISILLSPLSSALAVAALSARPFISSFFPMSGAPGINVTVEGGNFLNVQEVRFNNTLAIFNVLSPERLLVTVPLDGTSGPISITTVAGSAVTLSHFNVAPRIIGFSPGSGPPGTVVTIEGANFTGATAVSFNGKNAGSFSIVAATQIHATVPSGTASGPIRVTTPVGTTTSSNNFVIAGSEPVITSFTPTNGAPGAVVTIEGRNFTGATRVSFGNTNAASFSIIGSTQIRATVPAAAVSGPISVTTASGSGFSAISFVVSSAPLIDSFFPTAGLPGTVVVIEGANFDGATAVKFNGTNAASFAVTSSSQITAVVPAGATTGPVTVATPKGLGVSVQSFQVRTDPIITRFVPSSGAPGTLVTIDGFNFSSVTAVRFGTNDARYAIVAANQISATVPNGASTAPISVVSPSGVAVSSNSFIVLTDLPLITAITPTAGLGGSTVIIEGLNFLGATAVKFNGTNASFAVIAPTQIRCTVPADATTGRISVTTAGGTAFSSARFIAAPQVTSFSPASGIVGSSVVIRGTNLADVTAIRFNGALASFINATANEVTAVVPLNATSGPLSIATPAGIVATLSSFGVEPTPAELAIELSSDHRVVITWPAAAAGYLLQESERLSRPIWVTITNTPVLTGYQKVITVSPTSSGKFFRLIKP